MPLRSGLHRMWYHKNALKTAQARCHGGMTEQLYILSMSRTVSEAQVHYQLFGYCFVSLNSDGVRFLIHDSSATAGNPTQ